MTSLSKQTLTAGAIIGTGLAAAWYLSVRIAYDMGRDEYATYRITADLAMDAYKPTVYN